MKMIHLSILLVGLIISTTACNSDSFKGSKGAKETVKEAGLNGGFEIAKNNLPANWLIYNPKDADFKLSFDTSDFIQGNQSLRFDVISCSALGGSKSPGFTNEFFEVGRYKGEGQYQLTYWIKNKGAAYKMEAGAVSAFNGQLSIIDSEHMTSGDWKMVRETILIPKDNWLRIQFSITQAGSVWIDDMQIKEIK